MAATPDRQNHALQTIFSFFLGLMVLALIGVGVNTFYQSPAETYSKQQQDLSRQMEVINLKGSPDTLSASDRVELVRLQTEQNALQDKITAAMQVWGGNTSIILVIFATIVMSISLVRSEQLRVISNGLLLGGLFTMIYGVGWVIFSGTSTSRFFVIVFALVVTVGLGYLKFVRGRKPDAVAAVEAPAALASEELGDLGARVAALEARQAAAAAALSIPAPTPSEPS
jgi:hypothetical protein